MQLTHYNSKFTAKQFPITIICDGFTSPFNIGGIFRLADAFGAEELIFISDEEHLGKRYKKTSRSTEKYVPYRIVPSFEDIHQELLDKNYHLIGLEITEQSQALSTLSINPKQPVALVLGSENLGIQEHILKLLNTHIHIPMYGQNSSMNVVQSAAIALYQITNQLL